MRNFAIGAFAAAMLAGAGSAHAYSAQGNYQVTFTLSGGGPLQYCAQLVSTGPGGAYRDTGTITLTSGGVTAASGTYVVYKQNIYTALTNGIGSLTATGTFAHPGVTSTAVVEFLNTGAIILGTATFDYLLRNQYCAS